MTTTMETGQSGRFANPHLIGPMLVLCFSTITAVRSVFEGALLQKISPEFVALSTFGIAQVIYIITCKDWAGLLHAMRRSWRNVIFLNLTSAGSWVGFLYALAVLEPAVSHAIIMGLVPIITLLLARWLRPQAPALRLEIVASLGILLAMLYLAALTWYGDSAVGSVTLGAFVIGVISCVATAASLSANTIVSRRLSDSGMSARQVMTCRFPLTIIATFVLVIVRDSAAPFTAWNMFAFVVLALVGVMGALYLLQLGISKTEPVTVGLMMPAVVPITYVIQFFDPRLDQSLDSLAGVVLITGSLLLGIWARQRGNRASKRA